jgi:thioredoxin 1
MSSVQVTDQNFEAEVLNSSTPVVVDFWAEWCGPCKAMSPIIDQVAQDFGGAVKVVKINIDENPNTPTRYGIRGIPTFMIFKGGQLVDTRVGGMPKAQLTSWVQSTIA